MLGYKVALGARLRGVARFTVCVGSRPLLLPVVTRPESTPKNKIGCYSMRHEFLSESEIMGWFDGEILD